MEALKTPTLKETSGSTSATFCLTKAHDNKTTNTIKILHNDYALEIPHRYLH